MRLAYETTDISLARLAEQYGLLSDGGIRRRRDNEAWCRGCPAGTAGVTATATSSNVDASGCPGADGTLEQGVGEFERDRPALPGGAVPPPPQSAAQAAQATRNRDARAIARRTGPGAHRDPEFVRRRKQVREEIEESWHQSAKDMVEMHARAVHEQYELGSHVIAVARSLIDAIGAVVASPDREEAHEARSRLLSINPEKERLANLVKATVILGEWGVVLQRRALDMDNPKAVAELDKPPVPPGVQAVLGRLSRDTLKGLRQAALEVSQLSAAAVKGME